MSIGWAMGLFFIFVTMAFVAIAFFLPEWVGITGKKAKQMQQDHVDNESKEEPKIQH